MPELLGVAFELLVAITVLVTALTIGLDTTAAEFGSVVRGRRAVIAMLGVNGVVVPVAAFALVNALPVQGADQTGVLLCAMCASGPLGLKASQIARGDLAWAISITTILTVLNVAFLPLWTSLLLPDSVTARPVDLLGAMVAIIILPLVAGIWYRRRRPEHAGGVVPRLEALSNVTLALAVTVGLVAHFDQVWLTASSWTPIVVVILLALAGPAGYFASGPPQGLRRVSTLVTINRGTGIALLLASRSFADQAHVLSTVIAFGILQTIIVLAAALVWRRRSMTEATAR
jgi:BASS family bile acid:Na+ symporter